MVSTDFWSRYLAQLKKELSDRYYVYLNGMACRQINSSQWELSFPDKSSLSFVESTLSGKMKQILVNLLHSEGKDDKIDVVFALGPVQSEKLLENGVLPFDPNPIHVNDVSTIADRQSAFRVSDHHVEDSSENEPFVTSDEVRRQSRLNNRYTFDRFIMGSSNECALCAAKAVAAKLASAYNPLFIYGGVGLGKTHLIQAIGNEILDTSMLRVRYMTSEEFANQYIECVVAGGNKFAEFRRNMRDNIDVLLLDDIQFIAKKDRTQEEFFNTFNYLIENGKQVVLTSDRHPHEIQDIDERLRSRFCSDGWFDIQLPDFETRLAIIRSKSRAAGVYLPDDVAQYVAMKVATNVRELEGCIKRIKNAADVHNERISLAVAQKLIEPFYQTRQILLNVETIVHCVCTYFGISKEELMGRSRIKEISYPRKIAMYLARAHTQLSLPALGNAFGRDHTTVLSADQSIKKDLATNSELQLNIQTIEKKLFENR